MLPSDLILLIGFYLPSLNINSFLKIKNISPQQYILAKASFLLDIPTQIIIQ